MANIGNNQVTAGVDGAVIGAVSIANTAPPLPTTLFGEDVVFNNAASALTIPQNYAFVISGGIRANGVDASTGFLAADGAQIQVNDMPNRGFLNADFPLGFNGATVQFVNDTPARLRWPENAASGQLPFDGRNTVLIGQDVNVYSAAGLSGLASNTADAFLFHLGAGDTGRAFARTGTLATDDLQGHFAGVALDGISFAGAITLQIPADVDYIGVTFPDYNKVVAPEINNLRITAPKGGAVRTMIKDGVLPFGTGLRAQDAAGRVIILIGDESMFVRYQNPSSYGTTPTFTETYAQIVTGGVNAGTAGSFWRGYGWKPRFLDVALGTEIEDGFIDLNLPSGHFAIQPSDNNQVVPSMIATSASGAISHSVDSNDNDGYWIITDSETPDQQNTTPNIDTAVVYTPVTPYYMSHLVEASVTPIHVPSGATVESFDETQTHDFQFSSDILVGDRTFANASAGNVSNTNTTQAYAALKRANRDQQTGPFGVAIDTSTNGAAQVSINGSLIFSDTTGVVTSLASNGDAVVRTGAGFLGGLNDGATHNRWSATTIELNAGTSINNIAFQGSTSLNINSAILADGVILNSPLIRNFPNTFAGIVEDGSRISVGASRGINLEGATIEGDVQLVGTGTPVTITLEGTFTGTITTLDSDVTILIPVLFTVEPSLIAGTNGFFAIRNLTTSTTVIDVTISNGVIVGNSFFEVDASDTETYIAFYKLDSSITGDQVYRVATESFSGTSLSRNTLVSALTVPRPFTTSAIAVRPDGDGGDPVTMSYLQSGNTLIGTWLNNTTGDTRPNAFQTMTAVIDASNSADYFNWMESRALTIDPSDYSSDGATVFNNSVTGLSGLSTNDGIRWNSETANAQSQVSQAAGFFSDNVTGVTVQQILSFDIGNAPLGTVSAALAPQLAALPTSNDLDALVDEIKTNQQDIGNAFGSPASAGKGVSAITVTNPPL